MKKLFTLAAAVLTALTMNAQSTVFLWQYDGSSVYGDGSNNGIFDVADDANGIVKFVTYEKKKTSADGTSAYDASVTDNDLKPNITQVCKLGNNGAHLRISPASGNFQAGDSLFICGYKDYIVSTSSDPTSTAKITSADAGAVIIAAALATGTGKGACKVGYVVLPEGFAETNEIYISRANGTSAGVAAIKVVRPEQKTIDSTVETLTAVAINDYPIAPADLNTLLSAHTLILEDSSYLTAPVVKFTKHTVITYDDQTTKEKDEVIEKTSQQAQASMWGAMVDIAGVAYSVYTIKPLSYTVTYKLDDETVLGTEVVAAGTSPKEYAQYEVMPLSTFNGWYDSDYEMVDLAQVVVNSDTSFYADFDKAYAQSINIEQYVLDNGKNNDALKALLQERGFAYENINELDSLNDAKANRNEPYLGLKIKKNGGYIAFNVLPGQTLAVKFGYGEAPIKINVNGVDSTCSPVEKNLGEFELSAAQADSYIKISTTSDKTVVIKQIMIDEAIADVVLPDQPEFTAAAAPAVNGSILLNGVDTLKAHQGDTIMVTYTAASGYQIDTIKVGGKAIKEDQGIYKFVMPGNNVTVTATFKVYEETSFAITIAQSIANGNVSLNKYSANQGDTIIVTATPYDGYKIGQVTYGNEVIVPVGGVYFFIMPDHAVEVNVTFIEDKPIAPTYLVSISAPQNGTIEFADLGNEDHKYAQGDEVHLVITPAEGYKLVNANAGNEALTPDADGKCSFVMPGQDVTVSATFELIPVAPTYLVSISAPQNGTIEFADLGNEDHKYAQGDEVHLVITPAEGYKLVNANVGNEALTPDEDGKCSFVMPGQDVTITATFAPIAEGIEDVNAADKAVKRIQNGMLIIEKNGRLFNIIGARIK